MSTKPEQGGSKEEKATQKNSGTNNRRSNEKGTAYNSKQHGLINEDISRKRYSGVQPVKFHSGVRESRIRSTVGGRDSTHLSNRDSFSFKQDKYRTGTKDSDHKNVRTKDSQIRSSQSRVHKYTPDSRRAGQSVHIHDLGIQSPKLDENDTNPDSGIGIDENSSPETINTDVSNDEVRQNGKRMEEDLEDPMVDLPLTELLKTPMDLASSTEEDKVTQSIEDESVKHNCIKDNEISEDVVMSRLVYDRDTLVALKDCTRSLMTPAGFDHLGPDITKDILKSNHRHSGAEMWDFPHGDSEYNDDCHTKHPNTLSLIRDHEPKNTNKVSLTPQRRSFGSGCSWREAVTGKINNTGGTSTVDSPEEESNDDVFVNTPSGQPHHVHPSSPHGYSMYQHGTHPPPPRIIDHVPYRSRHSEWLDYRQPNRGSWRGKENFGKEFDVEEEPEWMEFGPSDRYEVMELKGLDEHEMEREARKDAVEQKKKENQENNEVTEESPLPSPLEKKIELKKDVVDSVLPPSHPKNTEEFILDGFDFSTGLSICHELATDNEEEKQMLPNVKDKHQMTNALMSMLGVPKEEENKSNPLYNKPDQRVLTLEELEEPIISQTDIDHTAFNRLLAALESSNTSFETDKEHSNDLSNMDHMPGPIRPPVKTVSRSLFNDEIEDSMSPMSNPFHDSSYQTKHQHSSSLPHMYATPTDVSQMQQRWQPNSTHWSTGIPHHQLKPQLLNPSPSSIGMHPHHLRQRKQSPVSSSWVVEMEQLRIRELNQLQQNRRIQHHQQQLPPQKSSSSSPSLSFLPTSVMRQIHNSKPNQSITKVARSPQHTTGMIEQEFQTHTSQSGFTGMIHHPDMHLPSPILPPHLHSHYPPPPPPPMRRNPRGHVDLTGYPTSLPHPQLQQQFRMGIPPMKPGLY